MTTGIAQRSQLEFIRIRECDDARNTLLPDDFASRPVMRAITTPHDRRTHATLRAIGFGRFESFAAVFGKYLIAAPEALDAAAGHYEGSSLFEAELLFALGTLGGKRDAELDARVSELTHHASDVARAVSMALSDNVYDKSLHRQPTDSLALGGILNAHAAELEEKDALGRGDGTAHWDRKLEGE
ncbi:hypothetical protein CY652_13120 [Burkholderia sp. WAC0059]|uniref:hypothetical protein n=1 Tax=Burkholderia sp. WAC0059 TaxID=2066022 RepID=UPI000C7EAABB|nr:hypothetical protein [Burkholderia sp. WAC0059]PLZ01965.1 hypothetical protein CY652_13120 [Burkholderia sp. WAC0059]